MSEVEAHFKASNFLYAEASLLDEGRLEEWLDLLSEDLEYVIPVRVGHASGEQFSGQAFLVNADKAYFKATVSRLRDEYGWASKQRSKTRRFVTNVVILKSGKEMEVSSNLLLVRTEKDEAQTYIVSATRRDVLKEVDGKLKLKKRTVLLDHENLPMYNLYFPL
ncbi:hypothetical protein HS1genome_0508 [Sulfodiicoccus acidiphilus]|uniref:Aromatic-ring-hydroxylating dioxygenase subunit beta n=1 Tax=Sulfodiicoccus acidiphilus TaxID=1670455 RepID=A0A348B1R7_9CREN|nr:aromatic-ring-hydroxylating dioxygenase subunit beta [Sulfodiicoccus acidiphilus]BBD72119.1 hypothetical protein HS1genome_0508 [Sulfodiicoccus acidiphilus]GGT94843.1 hypothetical protein GCM10007116_10560 [Sulfodiicoccus acidiphilus]